MSPKCEERHGVEAVERVLDAAHALKDHGVNRYAHRTKPNLAEEQRRAEEWQAHDEATYNDLWRTVPGPGKDKEDPDAAEARLQEIKRELGLPEENLLYLIEKRAPRLEDWQRELIRIVRLIAQYFYPQKQTQMMNEGLRDLRPLRDHAAAARQGADHRRLDARIPALAFERHVPAGFRRPALQRHQSLRARLRDDVATSAASARSRPRRTGRWFPDIAGNGDGYGVLRHAWANYRDESFVLQYLSPAMIRKFRLFHVSDDSTKPALRVEAIHDDIGYRKIRTRAVAAIRSVAARARHPGRRC